MNWISVKDSFPTDENNNGDSYNCVLVYSGFNASIAFAQYSKDHWTLHSDGIYSDVGLIGIEEKDITHWMPMPLGPYQKTIAEYEKGHNELE